MQTDRIVEHYNTLHKQHPFEHMDFWISLKLLLNTTEDCIEILSQLKKTASPRPDSMHFALQCGIEFDLIKFMVEEWVWEPWQMLDCDGKTPLHHAAVHTTDVRTVDLLGRWHTEWCLTRDKFGFTPLHCAIQNSRNINIVHALANCNPLSVQTKSASMLSMPNPRAAGATPLHLAVLAKSEFRIVQYLMNKFQSAVNVPNTNADLPIHDAIDMKSTNQIIALLTSGNNQNTYMSLLTDNSSNKIAVQQALEVAIDISSFTLLVVRTKSCISEICVDGATSISDMIDFEEASLAMYKKVDMVMYVIKYVVEDDIVDLLLSEFPSDGMIPPRNPSGDPPTTPPGTRRGGPLVGEGGGACGGLWATSPKSTLLHFAAGTKAPLAIMKKIYNYVPVAQRHACDSNSNSPLHYLLYNRHVPNVLDKTIFPQITTDSRFNTQPMDTRKKDAICYLLDESAKIGVVEFLVEAWPECVSIRNSNAQTPLDLAVTSYCQLDVIKFLYRKDKTLLHHIGYNGNTILHNASARIDIKHIMRQFNPHTTTGIILDLNTGSLLETLCFDSKCRTEVFMWIYSACEALARKKNIHNQLPVHIAAATDAEYSIIQKLVNKNGKEYLNTPDSYGNTPVQSMLSWEMGALHTNDKAIKHLVHEQVIQPLIVMQYMKNAVWSGQIDTDRLLLHNILSREEFTSKIVQHILPMVSMEDLMNKKTGIWAILENLKNSIVDQDAHVYISYYSNIIQAISPVLVDFRGLHFEETSRVTHLERSYSSCSKHLQAFESKFPNDIDKLLGIKSWLSNVSTRIECIRDSIKMNKQSDMNALHLIEDEERRVSTESKKRQNRSKRGLHTKIAVQPETTGNILKHEHDMLKIGYESLQMQHTALEKRHLELEQQYQTLVDKHDAHLQETVTLKVELRNVKQQHKSSQKQNKRLHGKLTKHEDDTLIIPPDQAVKNQHACTFCGCEATFCQLGIHTCKKCIDILYL